MLGISKTAYAETADTIVINSENFSNYFGEDGYLKESVKEGSTLDFQGTFSGNKYSLFINKKVNIISSTNNALFENTVDKDNIIKFYIGEGADYTI